MQTSQHNTTQKSTETHHDIMRTCERFFRNSKGSFAIRSTTTQLCLCIYLGDVFVQCLNFHSGSECSKVGWLQGWVLLPAELVTVTGPLTEGALDSFTAVLGTVTCLATFSTHNVGLTLRSHLIRRNIRSITARLRRLRSQRPPCQTLLRQWFGFPSKLRHSSLSVRQS